MVREQEGQCVLRFCGYMAMVVWGDRGIWACDRGTQLRGCGGYSNRGTGSEKWGIWYTVKGGIVQ